jgi:hypothetical protein
MTSSNYIEFSIMHLTRAVPSMTAMCQLWKYKLRSIIEAFLYMFLHCMFPCLSE